MILKCVRSRECSDEYFFLDTETNVNYKIKERTSPYKSRSLYIIDNNDNNYDENVIIIKKYKSLEDMIREEITLYNDSSIHLYAQINDY